MTGPAWTCRSCNSPVAGPYAECPSCGETPPRKEEKPISDNDKLLYCNFCGKSQKEVKLIAGPTVFICYECVDMCYDIKREKEEPKSGDEVQEKYRVTYPVLTSGTFHQDFDTMADAMAFDGEWRKKEDDFLINHKRQHLKLNISRIREKKFI